MTEKQYKFVNDGGINWSWLFCYKQIDDRSIEVVFYDRWHKYEPNPAWVNKCFAQATFHFDKRESEGRILEAVSFDCGRTWMDVVNKKYVFSYREFGAVMAEMEKEN